MKKWVVTLLSVSVLGACAVGPEYQVIDTPLSLDYASVEGVNSSAWIQINPDLVPGPQPWWQLFQDPVLDQWVQELHKTNLDLELAEARYRQAQASLQQVQAGFFPTVGTQLSTQRSGSGQNSPTDQYNFNVAVSWEPDVWGRVRRSVEAGTAQQQASAADLDAIRLSLESLFVQSYFQAKNVRAAQGLYEQTIAAYERSLQMTQNRLQAGLVSIADVANAEAQLENARTQALALERQELLLRNAMAVLLGKAPASFELQAEATLGVLPVVPVGLPAQLLTRRPDLVAAERRVAAANAQIGVATAAWFPNLTLSAQGGYRSGSWSDWISAPARFWSLGPALALTLFDGGARAARIQEAQAAYEVQAATYKKAVLEALQEVEDALVQWHGLRAELSSQERAVEAARRALLLTRNQYEAGLVDYLSVAQVETSTLSAERSLLSLQSELYLSAVRLIAALGGQWDHD